MTMEHTKYCFSLIFLVTLVVTLTVSVFIQPSRAAQLPEHLPDLATALPPIPTLVPVPPLAQVPPVPPLALVPPVPPLAPVLPHPPPLPVLPPLPDLPQLPPAPLLHPPLLPPVPISVSVPVPSPPDTPCYPALLTCKSINDTGSDPSQMCCQNMEAVYKNGTECICKVLNSSQLSSDLGLDAADISNMLVECKITDKSISLCASSAPPPSNAKILTALPSMSTIILALMYLLSV